MLQLKIVLKGSKPPIWRRLLIPNNTSLDKLHDIIQIAMGWTDMHLHQFICNSEYYEIPNEDGITDTKNEIGVKVSKFLKKEKDIIVYEYDFGDGWLHEVILEKIIPFERNSKTCCMKGVGACPPEDCGGIFGYYHMLEVLSDEKHPEYDDMLEWLGEGFDAKYFDLKETNEMLDEYVN